jgi:hypothetical protein
MFGPAQVVANADGLRAERDRLAADNVKLRKEVSSLNVKLSCATLNCDEYLHACWVAKDKLFDAEIQLDAANATLARLQEVVPEVLPPHMSWKNTLDGARAILYPPVKEVADLPTDSGLRTPD